MVNGALAIAPQLEYHANAATQRMFDRAVAAATAASVAEGPSMDLVCEEEMPAAEPPTCVDCRREAAILQMRRRIFEEVGN